MCPGWEFNPGPFGTKDNIQPTELHRLGVWGVFDGPQYHLPPELCMNPRMVAKIFFPNLIPQMWQQSMMVFAVNGPKLMPHVFWVEEL